MKKIQDDILSYREMCDAEDVQTLQRGMNFRMNPSYSVILMSQRANAPYQDRIHEDGLTIEYEGHDVSKKSYDHNPKSEDQPEKLTLSRVPLDNVLEVSRRPNPLEKPSLYSDTAYLLSAVSRTKTARNWAVFVCIKSSCL